METSREMLEMCACTRLRTAARLVTRAYDDVMRPAGIKASQLAVLAAIDAADETSIAGLSKVLHMDRTTLSRNLKPLLAEKFITLSEDGYGRSKTARITKSGENTLRKAFPLWRKAQDALLNQAGKEHLNDLHFRLRRLIRTY